MRSVVRVVIILLALTLEVRVQAAENSAEETSPSDLFVQSPEDCLSQGLDGCAIRSPYQSAILLLNDQEKVVFDASSSGVLRTGRRLRLVEGTLWIKVKDPLVVETEYGEFRGQGEFWVRRDPQKVSVAVTQGMASILPRGSKEEIKVYPGQENWLAAVGERGRALSGVPVVMDYPSHLKNWRRLYRGGTAEWKKEAQQFFSVWRKMVQLTSFYQKALAEEFIEKERLRRLRRLERRKALQAKEKSLRDLFRQRVFSISGP